MSIRRQYSLPHCTLMLEGIGEHTSDSESGDSRPILSSLTKAECHLVGCNIVLKGKEGFLENLVRAVSAYAQECLSGIHHPPRLSPEGDEISLRKLEGNLHRLVWKPSPEVSQEEVQVDLTSVQLFDLVEAVDQFFADSQTLPDLTLKLQPVSRRYRQSDEPLVHRLVPFALGVSSLAIATVVCFFMPVPEVRKPQPKEVNPTQTLPKSEESPLSGTNPGASNP